MVPLERRVVRDAKLLTALRSQSEKSSSELLEMTERAARERERATRAARRRRQRDEQASILIEDLRSSEARGDGKEARLALLQKRAHVGADERELFDTRLGQLHTRMEAHEEALANAREERMVRAAMAARSEALRAWALSD